MAKKSKTTTTTTTEIRGGEADDANPSEFASAITRIAVAQICQSIGFRGINASALRILSDVAARYLRAIGESAASSAVSSGRTQSNLYDIVVALENLNSVQGFRGASVIDRDLLSSSTLSDLAGFVRYNAEIPFAKPIHRRRQPVKPLAPPSGSHATVPNRFFHIPRWLPAIPEMGIATETITSNNNEIEEDKGRDFPGGSRSSIDEIGGKLNMESELPLKRETVRFRIGGGNVGLGLNGGVMCKGEKKRVSCQTGGIVGGDEACMKKKNASSTSNSRSWKMMIKCSKLIGE